jgi:nucleotide-binding universal stress UspA family protein
LNRAKYHLGDTSIQTLLKEGDPAQMILITATEMNADCIVMGFHRQKWMENILLESVIK